jgi:hypothetical protein
MVKLVAICLCLIFHSNIVQAGMLEDYQNAKLEYINALVCLATYSDRTGQIARNELAEAGWRIKPYKNFDNDADAKFFFVENDDFESGHDIYILAITGTESFKDIAIDLNIHKVYFGGASPTEFIENAKKHNLTSEDPMIHSGFNQYTQTALFTKESDGTTYGEYIAKVLKEDSKRKLYLVGHSLGGAVATIGAVRLVSLGVDPQQLEVITFGAPAVGNQAFVDEYGSKINLKRVVIQGDLIKSSLQSISGGYSQFGDQEVWQKNRNIDKQRHAITVYLDAATRNFYDIRKEALATGAIEEKQSTSPAMVYVAPSVINLPKEIAEDQFYMRENLKFILSDSLHSAFFAEGQRGRLQEELEKAKQAGCKWLLLPEITASKLQDKHNQFYLSFQEDIYLVEKGTLLGSFANSSSSKDFTPIEASMHNVAAVKHQQQESLGYL